MITYNQEDMNKCEEAKGAVKGACIFIIIMLLVAIFVMLGLIFKQQKFRINAPMIPRPFLNPIGEIP